MKIGPALTFVRSQHDLMQQGMSFDKSYEIVASKYRSMINDQKYINTYNRDLTKDNR